MVYEGPAQDAVEWYLDDMEVLDRDNLRLDELDEQERGGDGRLRFTSAYLIDRRGRRTHAPTAGEQVDIVLEYEAQEDLPRVTFWIRINNQMRVPVTVMHMRSHDTFYDIKKGKGRIRCHVPRIPFPIGAYNVRIQAKDYVQGHLLDAVGDALEFEISASTFFGSDFNPDLNNSTVLVDHEWTHEEDVDIPVEHS